MEPKLAGLYRSRKVSLVIATLALLAWPSASRPQDANALSSVLVYVPFDGSDDAYLGTGGGVRGTFSRPSIAFDAGLGELPANTPRWREGRFGQGLFIESGDYGDVSRGMQNWLPVAAAEGEVGGFVAIGDADLAASEPLVGVTGLRVTAALAGDGAEALPAEAPAILRYIGSAYVRGEVGGETVELLVEDRTNGTASEPARVELTTEWQRVFTVLPYDLGMEEFGGQPLASPMDLRLIARSASPNAATFYVDCLQVEQAGRHYSNRLSPTSWVPGMTRRAVEMFQLPLTPQTFNAATGCVALWVQPSEMLSVKRFFQVNDYWDQPFYIAARGDGKIDFAARGQKAISPIALKPNTWAHVALCWDETGAALYVDGEPAGTAGPGEIDTDRLAGGTYRYTIGSSHRAPLTCADGVVDEFASFNRALTADEVAALAGRAAPLPLAPEVTVQWANAPRCLGRDLGTYNVPLRALNRSDRPIGALAVTVEIPPLAPVSVTVSVPANASAEVALPITPSRLRQGRYDARVTWAAEGLEEAAAIYPIRIGPSKDREQFQIVSWYGGSRETQRRLRFAGVTVVDAGNSASIDVAAGEGLFAFSHLRGPSGFPRPGRPEDRVMRCDGSPGSLNPRSPDALQAAAEQAEAYARAVEHYPSFVASIVNTEWNSELDFSPEARAEVLRRFGIDMRPWMVPKDEAWNIALPFSRLSPTLLGDDWRPPDGVASEDDPLLRFTEAWHKEFGSEVALNERMVDAIHAIRPDITCILEPILRCPPVIRYAKADIAQEWVYYQDPKNMIPVQESLSAISEGLATLPTGMPQFLFKPGTAAPYAATPPPDMLREAVWLCCSRPIELMTFWGWHRVLSGDGMQTLQELEAGLEGLDDDAAWEQGKKAGEKGGLFIPEVIDEMSALSEGLWQPYGRLIREWRNRPRKLAVIRSLAASLYSNERWWSGGWMMKAITATGVPYDVLYDDAFADATVLDGYDVIVLPNTPAVTAKEAAALRTFIDAGGLVIGDENCGVAIPGIVRLAAEQSQDVQDMLDRERELRQQHADTKQAVHPQVAEEMQKLNDLRWRSLGTHAELAGHLDDRLDLEIRCETPGVVYNVLEAEGATYLVAVNDKRVFGEYLGRWERVREKGVAQRAEFVADQSLGAWVTALTPGANLTREAEGDQWRLSIDLPPCGGQIIGFFAREPQRLTVTQAGEPKPGGDIVIDVQVAGANGLIPARVDVIEPDGTPSDLSRDALLRQGSLEFPLPLAVNDPTGEWRVRVTELARNQQADARIEVR